MSCEQLIFFGYLSSQGNPERPTCEIGFKPVECRSGNGRQEDQMIHSVKSELMIWNQLSQSAGL